MQRNKKFWPINREIKTNQQEISLGKLSNLNVFKELKESMRIVSHQIENVNYNKL